MHPYRAPPDFTSGSWQKNNPVELSIDHGNLTPVKQMSIQAIQYSQFKQIKNK